MNHCMKPLRGILALCLLALAGLGAAAQTPSPRPNIIFVLTDDQGYGDLSCHGNSVLKTPNLDRLHDEAVRFTDFHVSPTCAPTRSALNTGRHEFRNGVTHTIYERERLTLNATTLAQVLQGAGYTTGIFGKWHLGDEAEYQPNRRGFDEVFIHGGGGIGQTFPGSCGDAPGNTYFNPAILHNGKFEKTHGYCTDVFFQQALNWIQSVKGQRLFYAYIACNAPHAPLQVPKEYEQLYAGKVDADAAKFFGMIANIDDNIGRLLTKLKEWGLERDTLVVFMNDNGGTAGTKVFNAGMRGQKVTPWLGGTRAISFWRWPGTFKPADVGALAAHIDFYPTIAELAGAKLSGPVQAQVEGRSLVPLLRNPAAVWTDRVLFTHVGRWERGHVAQAKYRECSVRTTRWHMVCVSKTGDKQWQLFDVKADPGEKNEVAASHPDVVKELDAAYDKWWDSVQPQLVNENAVGPKVNPFKELYWKQFGKEAEPHAEARPAPGKWVVVAAPAFASALNPLVEQRRADGLDVTVLETTQLLTHEQIRAGNGAPLRERLQGLFSKGAGPKHLLLVGVATNSAAPVPEEVAVPPLVGTTARMKGQSTDYGYCLPDAAGRPTVAVGRFPARNADELQGMIAKTLGLERARSSGEWRSHVLLVQGNPGGGSMAEAFLDAVTRPRMARLHPAWQFSAISDDPPSLYYLPAALLQSRSLEWLVAGQLFSVYLGHSNPTALSSLSTRFLSTKDWAKVDMSNGQGVFFSCGCYGCQWDRGPQQAYCLAAMRNPKGPAAVIGAYKESYAACGLLAVDGLLRCCAEAPFPTRLADYWLAVQDGLLEGKIDATTFTFLDQGDGSAGKVPLSVQRPEHLEMWTLLGDPALRLPLLPLTVSLRATSPVSPATRLRIEGDLPENLAGAKVRLSLERAIGTRPADLQALPELSSDGAAEHDRIAAENNRKVNKRTIATATTTAHGKSFTCSLEVPANLAGPMVVVRAFAEAGTEIAEGVLKLPVMTQAE
jgi:arylsulfatase A-like enzyme